MLVISGKLRASLSECIDYMRHLLENSCEEYIGRDHRVIGYYCLHDH